MKKFILSLLLFLAIHFSIGSKINPTQNETHNIKVKEFLNVSDKEIDFFYEEIYNKEFENFKDFINYWMKNHPVIKAKQKLRKEKEIQKFLSLLAYKESSYNWKVINRYGYIGKYQFGGAALKDLGVYDTINYYNFKENPWIFPPEKQDSLLIKLMQHNKNYLSKYLDKYRGHTINGIKINDASVLAAAHLVGMGNMKKFFESNGKFVANDGNKVPATQYMKDFQDIKFIL